MKSTIDSTKYMNAVRHGFCFLIVVFAATIAADAQTLTRGPYLQRGGTSEITVCWRTSSNTNSMVRYGTSPGTLDQSASSSSQVTNHAVRVTGLLPNTKYFYSVGTSTTTLASGSSYFFVTAPTTAKSTRVWVLGDSGTADNNQRAVRDRYYEFTDQRHTDLWLMLGDNAYNDGTDAEYQSAVFDIYGPMLRKSVLWPTLGNHDARSADSPTQTGVYYDIFVLPKQGEGGGVASGTEAYYSFDYGNIHFVCLDSHDTSRSPTGAMANWLRADLADNAKDWTIAFWHHPPYSKGSHDSDTESRMVQMRENFLPILEEHGVDLVLTGHSHSYERSFFINGHYGVSSTYSNSTHRVQSGSGRTTPYRKSAPGPIPNLGAVYTVAGSSGKISGGNLNHPAMYTSMNVLGSVILDFNDTRLDLKFLDNQGAIRDYFTLVKDGGATKLTLPNSSVTASGHDGNVPTNTVDASLGTRWSASGLGQWISYDLGSTHRVSYVKIAFYKGDERASIFDVQTSTNGSSWTTVASRTSSGATTALETFDFNDTDARYVRIVGYGNTNNLWNSFTEVEVWGVPTKFTVSGGSVAASSHDGNVPANTVDGNLSTRWSASGLGEWIRFDLGSRKTIASLKIAFYKGNERQSYFDVQTSDSSSGPWTTISSHTSSGTSTALESFDFTDTSARYVRILGYGNSNNLWNSYTEVEIWGYNRAPGKAWVSAQNVTASSSNSNLPEYAVDGDFGTRWSASGAGEWIKLDTGAVRTIDYVKIAFLLGETRYYYFDIDVSSNNSTWTPVLNNQVSSGSTLGFETFHFGAISGRYVRITGYGNTTNLFNNYSEVEVWSCD